MHPFFETRPVIFSVGFSVAIVYIKQGRVRKFGRKNFTKRTGCIIGSRRRVQPGRGTRARYWSAGASSSRVVGNSRTAHRIQVWRRRERSTGRQVRGSRRRGIDAHFSWAHEASAVGAKGRGRRAKEPSGRRSIFLSYNGAAATCNVVYMARAVRRHATLYNERWQRRRRDSAPTWVDGWVGGCMSALWEDERDGGGEKIYRDKKKNSQIEWPIHTSCSSRRYGNN